MNLSSEGYSPGLLKKIEYAGGNARSFATAAESLERLAEFSISGKHVERLTERLGRQRADQRDQSSAAMRARTLRSSYKQPPSVAVISVDAGKAQFREEDSGPGVHGARWGDTKVACLQTYSDVSYDRDPQPEPPEAFVDPQRVERLCRQMERVRGSGVDQPGKKDEPEKIDPRRKKKNKKRKHRSHRPKRLVRTVVATTAKVEAFGWMLRTDRSAAKDAARVVELTIAYVERNRDKMDYPRYRRMGLPVSSSLVESLVKQINHRVKGTEQFWNDGGLEAVLQVRAAYLSQDDRAEQFHEQRPRGPAVGRNRTRPFQPAG